MAFDWDDLLDYLEDGTVIPVIGRELLEVDIEGRTILLDEYLALRLAERLEVPGFSIEKAPSLAEVAFAHLGNGGERNRVYNGIRSILKRYDGPVPDSLHKLVAIREFKLFVSTTADELMAQALMKSAGREEQVSALAYKTELPVEDLYRELESDDMRTVYQIFGRASSLPDYAVTEEDHLEFLHALQSKDLQPVRLLEEMRRNNLLLLGCGLPSWLVRFFVRTMKNERLLDSSNTLKILVDRRARDNERLVMFLNVYRTDVYEEGGAVEFVDELHRRWMERQQAGGAAAAAPEPDRAEDADIFLSYASEDRPSVEALKQRLDEAGLRAWFDLEELPAGIDWDRRIRQNLQRCSIFVPCLSRQAEARQESYFRREWNLAIERSKSFTGSERRYIWPVALDDVSPDSPRIPDEFELVQWSRLEEGVPTRELLDELKSEIRTVRAADYR
jgi:hypothetical protein